MAIMNYVHIGASVVYWLARFLTTQESLVRPWARSLGFSDDGLTGVIVTSQEEYIFERTIKPPWVLSNSKPNTVHCPCLECEKQIEFDKKYSHSHTNMMIMKCLNGFAKTKQIVFQCVLKDCDLRLHPRTSRNS